VSDLRLYLFDDGNARRWAPFTLTRPAGELRFGILTLRERAQRVFGVPCSGHLSRRALAGFDESDAAPVVQWEDVPPESIRVLLSSRAVPDFQELPELVPGRLTMGGETVGWVLAPGEPLPPEASVRAPGPETGTPTTELAGEVLDRPWNLVSGTPDRVLKDVDQLFGDDHHPPGVVRIGKGRLSLGTQAEVEPGVVVDTRHGPVRLEEGVRVEGPARLVGPLWVGRGSMVAGGHVASSSLGPMCRVRGELVCSVFTGWDNKAHDGFLGHAMLGRWVNLGAGTTNSNLKNTYGTVRVWTPDGERDSKLVKVGCFLGDHVKVGVGTILNTGTVVGAGSNVFGKVMPPTVIPPFAWGAGDDLQEYRFEPFIRVAEAAMARRGEALTPGVRRILAEAWQSTRARRAD
jgi:UDP-N-acetylglucosamine diphosphorylase/glucosamine-1-phosphate N-acetyltransferase